MTARLLLSFVVLAVGGLVAWSVAEGAQSGRRTPKPSSPVPAATPEAGGESESQSKPKKRPATGPTFIVCQLDNPFLQIAYITPESMVAAFARRLTDSNAVEVVQGAKVTRQEARDRAKNEKEAFTVLVSIEDEMDEAGREVMGELNPRRLAVRLFVYEPRTGQIKYQDRMVQRPYRQAARVGGVRIPVPTPRTAIPTRDEVEQVARDSADRLLMRFGIRPPDN
ncbi:MAG TPA: hypothetical protein VGV59_05140 [Pyrinomonadaceae bacterium]|nr:hypothetical protein [Pyrinomonadaceae bacterium]